MEQPSTESVSDVVTTDKETANVTKTALESDEHINVHESVGHKVITQLKVTGG
jgi:hypothetical protein